MKQIQRCLHRDRIRVITVVNQRQPLCVNHVASAVHRLHLADSRLNLLSRQPKKHTCRRGSECIVEHVFTRKRNFRLKTARVMPCEIFHMNPCPVANQSPVLIIVRIDYIVAPAAKKYRNTPLNLPNRNKFVIVSIQADLAALLHKVKNLCLCL